MAGVRQRFPRAGEAQQHLHIFSRDGCSHSCCSVIPRSHSLRQPLAVQPPGPNECGRLVRACSTWSLCGRVAMLVTLSRNAAVHRYAWFARSTVLPGQGQETNPPCWEELSRRQKPLAACRGHADVIRSIRLGNKVMAWEQQYRGFLPSQGLTGLNEPDGNVLWTKR